MGQVNNLPQCGLTCPNAASSRRRGGHCRRRGGRGCTWQRGTNENTNGLLREYFPKRTPLDGISPTRIQQVHDQLNQRPRKRLGWKTPEEAYTHRTLHFL